MIVTVVIAETKIELVSQLKNALLPPTGVAFKVTNAAIKERFIGCGIGSYPDLQMKKRCQGVGGRNPTTIREIRESVTSRLFAEFFEASPICEKFHKLG
jgi:hypothetical protein